MLEPPAVTSVTPFVSSDQSDFKTWSTKFLRIVNQSAYIEDGSKKMHLGKSDDWFTITDACKLATSIQLDQQSGHESDEISAPVITGLLANSTVFFCFLLSESIHNRQWLFKKQLFSVLRHLPLAQTFAAVIDLSSRYFFYQKYQTRKISG